MFQIVTFLECCFCSFQFRVALTFSQTTQRTTQNWKVQQSWPFALALEISESWGVEFCGPVHGPTFTIFGALRFCGEVCKISLSPVVEIAKPLGRPQTNNDDGKEVCVLDFLKMATIA